MSASRRSRPAAYGKDGRDGWHIGQPHSIWSPRHEIRRPRRAPRGALRPSRPTCRHTEVSEINPALAELASQSARSAVEPNSSRNDPLSEVFRKRLPSRNAEFLTVPVNGNLQRSARIKKKSP